MARASQRSTKINAMVRRAAKAVVKGPGALPNVYVSRTLGGPPVTTVKQNELYWLMLINTSIMNTADFIVSFKPGAPMNLQHHRHVFPGGGYGSSIAAPFGVPAWGANAMLGPSVLTALVNGVSVGNYSFTVVA